MPTKGQKMIKAIIFDMDGTLVDSEPLHKAGRDRQLADFGLPVEEVSAKAIGRGKHEFWSEVAKTYGLPISSERLAIDEFKKIIAIIKENGIPTTNGINELLSALKAKGIKMAVASSSDKEYVEFIISYLGWDDYFSVTACGDEVTMPKPSPEIYLLALERLHISADEALAVEDSTTGSRAACDAGIKCIGYEAECVEIKQHFSLCAAKVSNMIDVLAYI